MRGGGFFWSEGFVHFGGIEMYQNSVKLYIEGIGSRVCILGNVWIINIKLRMDQGMLIL